MNGMTPVAPHTLTLNLEENMHLIRVSVLSLALLGVTLTITPTSYAQSLAQKLAISNNSEKIICVDFSGETAYTAQG
ncbi:MAG: hypothetical protein NT032_08350, partial [Actinobacteria bacterium]|nr:hypothetical protein [Actinomycetota bacterium]